MYIEKTRKMPVAIKQAKQDIAIAVEKGAPLILYSQPFGLIGFVAYMNPYVHRSSNSVATLPQDLTL